MNTFKTMFMFAVVLSLAELTLNAGEPAPRGAGAVAKPNIVLIVADDLGYNDVGNQGDGV